MTISQVQAEEIRQSLLTGEVSPQDEVDKMVNAGFNEIYAEKIVADIVKSIRAELFNETLEKQKGKEAREVSFVVSLVVSMIGPVFEISSLLWYFAVTVIAGFAGYYGFKDKPFAGIAGSVVFVVLFPFTYNFYFSGRTSFINIEIILPLFLAILPAYLTLLLISTLFYRKTED